MKSGSENRKPICDEYKECTYDERKYEKSENNSERVSVSHFLFSFVKNRHLVLSSL